MPICEGARAKINLTLSVRGRRSDGYHELESLVAFAQVHDTVTIEPDAGIDAGGPLTVSGPFAHAISGENLLTRAIALLHGADAGLHIGPVHLVKSLPVAAGIGGGSADAAALLRAVRRANPARADAVPWLQIAARLGADVPVCFIDRPALIWGVGERMAPLRSLPSVDAVLINPRLPLATGTVFAALQAGPTPDTPSTPAGPVLSELQGLVGYAQTRRNDLEAVACKLLPVIGEVKSLLAEQPGCRLAGMSGSGPTCFGIFSGPASARHAATGISAAKPDWWVECTVIDGSPARI